MKQVALGALWAAIAVQSVWITKTILHQHGLHGVLFSLLATLAFAIFAVTRGRWRWLAMLLRMFIGVEFLMAVGDRLGVFGAPGTPGVSWGNFRNFTVYTGQVNAFLPAAVIPALAVIETIIEGVLGLAMLLGAGLRVTVWASSALLFAFAIAMTISLGLASQFGYAVFVLGAGTWVRATADASLAGIDALLGSKSRSQAKGYSASE